MAESKLEDDPRFKFGPPLIQTAEDAMHEFLRESIDEKELEEAVGKFGHTNDTLWVNPNLLERPDHAFERTLPDSVFKRPDARVLKVDERLELAEKKEEVRNAATEAADKITSEATNTQPIEEAKNEAARKAAEEPQKELDEFASELQDPEKDKKDKPPVSTAKKEDKELDLSTSKESPKGTPTSSESKSATNK